MSPADRPEPSTFAAQEAAASPRQPVAIGLVQINNSFFGPELPAYSVALLQTYVQKMSPDPGRYKFLPSLYKRLRIADAVEALKDADLVGFSTYVWNGRISLEIARRLKLLKPRIVIVFGGPHVPTNRRLSCGQTGRSISRSTMRRAHVPEAAGSIPRPQRLGTRYRA